MKVCPVCEMEEEDNALSCSMCGSDFEPSVKEVPEQESEDETKESDDISSDIAEMGFRRFRKNQNLIQKIKMN